MPTATPQQPPFPWASVGTLWTINFATTFANWSVIPFVPYIVFDLGLVEDYREPGLYAGMIIAANRIGAMLTSYAFGRWSDKHGRRPVLQVMLLGLSTTTLLFGFSSSLEMALVVRFVGGLSAGGRELTQVMATELCQGCPEHQAKAMSTNAAMWGLAVIVGPALGGLLARPAINYPGVVAADGVWGRYPYLPPCLFGSVLCMLSLLMTRTLPETVGPNKNLQEPASTDAGGDDSAEEEGEGSALLAHDSHKQSSAGTEPPQDQQQQEEEGRCYFATVGVTRTIVAIKLIQAFYVVGDDNTFPLWTAAPRYAGGLDFSTSNTGTALAMMGATVVFAQLVVYPKLSKALGPRRTFSLLTALQVPFFALQPFASGFEAGGWGVWAWLGASCVKNMCIEMSIVGQAILQNNAVGAEQRGALSGFASAVSGVGQTLAPLVTAPLFAWSLTNGRSFPLNVWLLFLIYSGCAALNSVLGATLPLSINRPK